MKSLSYSLAIASLSNTIAAKLLPSNNSTPPLDVRDISARSRNLLARQSYDYCGTTSYYCINSNCCGITVFNCMDPGGECCADLSEYGYGLWCTAGTTCVIENGLVQCQDESGDVFSADSSAAEIPTATATGSDEPFETGGSSSGGSSGSSGSRTKTKKKSKAWIAAAVIVPLIGIAVIAGIVFFLFMLRKKKRANANASAVPNFNQQGGGPGNPPAMTQQQPVMSGPPPATPAPQMGMSPMPQHATPAQNPDLKTPAYTQQYEVPSPVSSPPPQWTPASPAPTTAQPVVYAYQQGAAPELHGQAITSPVSPMNTGNGGGYTPPMQQSRPVYPNAMEMPAAQAPRQGAQELQ